MTDTATTPPGDAGTPDTPPLSLRDYLENQTTGPATVTPSAPSTGRIIDAAFEENIVGSLVASKSLQYGLLGGDDTPMTDAELNESIEQSDLAPYADRFLDTTTRGHFDAVKADIQRELDNDQALAMGGATALAASLVAGVVDIPTLIPFGHAVRLGRVGQEGASLLGTAGKLAVTSAIDAGVTEAALHGIQQTRTTEESAYNIGGSILLTTALGTGLSRLLTPKVAHETGERLRQSLDELKDGTVEQRLTGEKARLLETTQRAASGEVVESTSPPRGGNPFDDDIKPGLRDALDEGETWDVASQRMTPDQLALADTLGVAPAAKSIQNTILFGGNIQLNLITAKAPAAREFIANLTYIPVELKGNAAGINSPQSAVSMRAALDGKHATATRSFMDAYKQFRSGTDLSGKDLARFSRLVAFANANGDQAPTFMARNDGAEVSAAMEAAEGMTEVDWRALSSKERLAIEVAAKATRGFFTEIAEANIRAGLMRRRVLNAGKAEKAGGTIDGELSGAPRKIEDGTAAKADGATDVEPSNLNPENFVDSGSYLKHVYKPDRILNEEAEFIRTEAEAWIANWEAVNGRKISDLKGAPQKAVFKSAMNHASGVFRAIIHGVDSEGQSQAGKAKSANLRGSVLERNVMLPTKELLKRGWIEDDVLGLMHRALRQNGTDAMLATRFRREPTIAEMNLAMKKSPDAYWLDGSDPASVPDLAMAEPKRRIQTEYEELIANAKTEKERVALVRESQQMLSHVEDSVNILRGRYRPQDHLSPMGRTLSVVREFNFATRMGNVVLSSLPDLGMTMLQHGPARVARYAIKRSGSRVKELLSGDAETVAQIKREARAASVAIETENMSRISGLADIAEPFSNGWTTTPIERLSRNLVGASGKVFGITYWNNALQRINYGIFSDRVARIALDPKSATAADTRWLAHHGINDKAFLDSVAKNLQTQSDGGSRGGVYFAEASNWDRETQERFFAAARDSARSTVITPELLDKPLNAHSPVGSTLLQFTSFVMTSTMRATAQTAARLKIGNAAERAEITMSIASMMGLAAIGVYLRAVATDKVDDLPDFDEHQGWWTYEIADRSGLLGIFSHLSNLSDNAGFISPRAGIQKLFGDDEEGVPKYRRGPVETLVGPSGSTLRDALKLTGDLATGAVDAKTVSTARRMTPLVNAFFLRRMLTDPAEKLVTEDLLGLEAE